MEGLSLLFFSFSFFLCRGVCFVPCFSRLAPTTLESLQHCYRPFWSMSKIMFTEEQWSSMSWQEESIAAHVSIANVFCFCEGGRKRGQKQVCGASKGTGCSIIDCLVGLRTYESVLMQGKLVFVSQLALRIICHRRSHIPHVVRIRRCLYSLYQTRPPVDEKESTQSRC